MLLRRCLGVILVTVALALTGCAAAPAPTADERAEVATYVRQQLDAAWRGDGRNTRPATVQPLFYLPNGWGFRMQQCMIDSGYSNFNYFEGDGKRHGEESLAWYACLTKYPTYDTIFSEPSVEQLGELYSYYTDLLVPCLLSKGVPVDGVPTREEFLSGGEGQPGSWNPYLAAPPPASIGLAALLLEQCPAYPESIVAEAQS